MLAVGTKTHHPCRDHVVPHNTLALLSLWSGLALVVPFPPRHMALAVGLLAAQPPPVLCRGPGTSTQAAQWMQLADGRVPTPVLPTWRSAALAALPHISAACSCPSHPCHAAPGGRYCTCCMRGVPEAPRAAGWQGHAAHPGQVSTEAAASSARNAQRASAGAWGTSPWL